MSKDIKDIEFFERARKVQAELNELEPKIERGELTEEDYRHWDRIIEEMNELAGDVEIPGEWTQEELLQFIQKHKAHFDYFFNQLPETKH